MIDNLTFTNQSILLPIICIGLIIWLVFIWKEWNDHFSSKFILNSIIAFIALISLVLLILKPVTNIPANKYKSALLTEGYTNSQLDSLKKEHKKLKIYTYDSNHNIPTSVQHSELVFVLGEGLKNFDIWQLESVNVKYLGAEERSGVRKINYQTSDFVGNTLNFDGQYANATKGGKLYLENPGGVILDSVFLTTERLQEFRLSSQLKTEGNFVYRLTELDSNNIKISSDPIPVKVSKRNPLRILMVNNFPSFETKYLKNYLAESGHQIIVRSKLTIDRYKYEYFNVNNRPQISLNHKSLETFDLLIIDAASITSLSRTTINELKTAARDYGLGIFIQANDRFFNSNSSFASFDFYSDKNDEITLLNPYKAKVSKFEYLFRKTTSIQPIYVYDTNVFSAYYQLGLGRVSTSTFQNTYELVLKGNPNVYKDIWSSVINAVSKKANPISEWNSPAFIAYKDEPYRFKLRTKINTPNVLTSIGNNISLKGIIDINQLWYGDTYPKNEDWNHLIIEQDTTQQFDYFVADSGHWKSLKTFNTIKANKRFFNNQKNNQITTHSTTAPVNAIWFFVVLVLCLGFLWLTPRI